MLGAASAPFLIAMFDAAYLRRCWRAAHIRLIFRAAFFTPLFAAAIAIVSDATILPLFSDILFDDHAMLLAAIIIITITLEMLLPPMLFAPRYDYLPLPLAALRRHALTSPLPPPMPLPLTIDIYAALCRRCGCRRQRLLICHAAMLLMLPPYASSCRHVTKYLMSFSASVAYFRRHATMPLFTPLPLRDMPHFADAAMPPSSRR